MFSRILTFLIIIFSTTLYAQNVNVTGTVTEATSGQPLPGVNVLIKNTSRGASTDFDGNFSLTDVPLNSVLVFSYLGYQTKEVTVTNDQSLAVILEEDSQSLDEVVVIGYGTQTKK